jgi:hypothetical protein
MSIAFSRGERVVGRTGEHTLVFRAECRLCGRWATLPVAAMACVHPQEVVALMDRLRRRLERRGCAHAEQTAPNRPATDTRRTSSQRA